MASGGGENVTASVVATRYEFLCIIPDRKGVLEERLRVRP